MSEPLPKLDPHIVNQIYNGENCSTILVKTTQIYASVVYPSRVAYLHSLLIHAIRARRLDLVQMCFKQTEYCPHRIRQCLGQRLLSPLWEAVLVGDRYIFKYLLDRESDLTEQIDIGIGERIFRTSLLQASIKADNFRLFLKFFETQQQREPSRELYCLHEACMDGTANFLSKMVEDKRFSLDINMLNSSGHTPLCIAAWHNPDFIPLLLGGGANPNMKCKDGKTALSTLCKAISSGRTEHCQMRAFEVVKTLANSEIVDSSKCSPLRELISRTDVVVDQNGGNLATEYRDLIKLLSEHSSQESKALSLLDTVKSLYFILCGCLAHRSNSAKLSASLSSQRQQILLWRQKIDALNESGAGFDTGYWIQILSSVLKAKRSIRILFTNLQFIENYRFCLDIIHELLRRLPAPCYHDPECAQTAEKLVDLITDQPNLYLRFLCIFMESSTTHCSVVLCQHLFAAVHDQHTLNYRKQLTEVLEFLSERVWTLKYIVKKNIVALMRGKDCMVNLQKLPLPNDMRNYLVEDEIKWDNN